MVIVLLLHLIYVNDYYIIAHFHNGRENVMYVYINMLIHVMNINFTFEKKIYIYKIIK